MELAVFKAGTNEIAYLVQVPDVPPMCFYFGTDGEREIMIKPVAPHTGRVIAVSDGYERTPEGSKVIWRDLPPSEQYEVDLSSITKP